MSHLQDNEDIPFELVKKLGSGSFASVYKAVTKCPEKKQYAVKVVEINRMEQEKTLREVDNLRQVQGQNIIEFHQYIVKDRELLIVLRLCDGSLRNLMQKKKQFLFQEVMSLMVQVTAGMNTLNHFGVMHLDLKPDNILYVGNYHYKICDFGCSQLTESGSFVPLPTRDNVNFGTPRYICPQVKLGYGEKDLRKNSQDVWSFGVIVYEMVYGCHPLKINRIGDLDGVELTDFWQGKKQIQFPRKEPQFDLIKCLLKQILVARPDRRPTWRQIRVKLMNYLNRCQIQFIPLRKSYEHFEKTIQFILAFNSNIIADNSVNNPHLFWVDNQVFIKNFSNNLLSLSYVYCLKFCDIFSFKLNQYLTKGQVLDLRRTTKKLKQMVEQKNMAIPCMRDEQKIEKQFFYGLKKIKQELDKYTSEEDQWESLCQMKLFYQQAIKVNSLFCQVHKLQKSCEFIGLQ